MAWIGDDMAAGLALEREALEIFREIADPHGAAMALGKLGLYAWDADDLDQADAFLAEAETLAAPLRDPRLTAYLRYSEGILAAARGDHPRSLALVRESRALYERSGDAWQVVIGDWSVGIEATVLREFAEARTRFASCMQGGIALGNRWGIPFSIEAFAVLAIAQGEYERGAKLLGAAEGLRAKSGIASQTADHPAFRELLAAASEQLATVHSSAARREGREMSMDEAMAFALAQAGAGVST
jgi:non-specific serine/threonine protein kinase